MINKIADLIKKASRVYVVGNGGSSSTASHLASDLVRAGIRAFSLADNIALVTAIANDYGYDIIFSYQIDKLAEPGDLVIAISASGNSENVLNAAYMDRTNDVTTIGITGFDGGDLAKIVDHNVNFPAESIEEVEDLHLKFVHSLGVKIRNG